MRYEEQKQVRQEMLAALCLKDNNRELFSFVSPEEEKQLGQAAQRLLREGTPDSLKEKVLNLVSLGRHFAFEETHPDWFVEHFRNESPRLFSLLLRLLSAEKSEKILGCLTSIERKRLSRESGKISPEVLGVLRHLIEKKIGRAACFQKDQNFSFEHLATLKGEVLRTVLKDVGIDEICKAFHRLDPRIVRAFLARCSLSDARIVKERLSKKEVISDEAKQEAQKHLLSLDLGQIPPESFFVDIGFSVFAKAIDSREFFWVEGCCTKLPLAEGYRLKRILHEKRVKNEKGDEKAKKKILSRVVMLARQGKIPSRWKDEREVESTDLFQEESV